MTNEITITNFVWAVQTNGYPIMSLPWSDQTHYFLQGFQYGLPAALAMAVVWAVTKAVRGSGWFWNRE